MYKLCWRYLVLILVSSVIDKHVQWLLSSCNLSFLNYMFSLIWRFFHAHFEVDRELQASVVVYAFRGQWFCVQVFCRILQFKVVQKLNQILAPCFFECTIPCNLAAEIGRFILFCVCHLLKERRDFVICWTKWTHCIFWHSSKPAS